MNAFSREHGIRPRCNDTVRDRSSEVIKRPLQSRQASEGTTPGNDHAPAQHDDAQWLEIQLFKLKSCEVPPVQPVQFCMKQFKSAVPAQYFATHWMAPQQSWLPAQVAICEQQLACAQLSHAGEKPRGISLQPASGPAVGTH